MTTYVLENYLWHVRCWPRAHPHVFPGKPVVVSNTSGGLFFNRVKYHRTILALFVQCLLGSSFKGLQDISEQGPTLTGTSITDLPRERALSKEVKLSFIKRICC